MIRLPMWLGSHEYIPLLLGVSIGYLNAAVHQAALIYAVFLTEGRLGCYKVVNLGSVCVLSSTILSHNMPGALPHKY